MMRLHRMNLTPTLDNIIRHILCVTYALPKIVTSHYRGRERKNMVIDFDIKTRWFSLSEWISYDNFVKKRLFNVIIIRFVKLFQFTFLSFKCIKKSEPYVVCTVYTFYLASIAMIFFLHSDDIDMYLNVNSIKFNQIDIS